MGTLGPFIVFVLAIEHGRSYWMAIPMVLVFSLLGGAASSARWCGRSSGGSALGVVIVTLGIFLVMNALHRRHLGHAELTPLAPVANGPADQWVMADGPPRLAVRYSTIAIWMTLAVRSWWSLMLFFQSTKPDSPTPWWPPTASRACWWACPSAAC